MFKQTILKLAAGIVAFSAAVTSHPHDTAARTRQYLSAFEAGDIDTLAAMSHEKIFYQSTFSFDGTQTPPCHFDGKPSVMQYMSDALVRFPTIKYVDVNVTVSEDGVKSFLEANGRFTTPDGLPYWNVYVYRFDWIGDKVSGWVEYTNPIIFCNSFAKGQDCAALVAEVCAS